MIVVLIPFLIFNVLSTLNNRKCTQQQLYQSFQVTCSDVPDKTEWQQINNSTTHVLVTCAPLTQTVNMTLDNNQLTNMENITLFNIKNCPLVNFPKQYFKNLFYLENVVLDSLPLQSLQANIFNNSTNILQLTLIRLRRLQKVSPRFITNQKKLTKLHIIESNVTANQLEPLLTKIHVTLIDLHWRNNKQKLFFQKVYYKDFNFDNLLLENNEIDNTDFLLYLHTKHLSLKYNPISIFEKFKMPNIKELQSINLAFTGLSKVFPEFDKLLILPNLTELIISDNRIEGLPQNIDIMFPKLRILDIRNNRISTLSQVLNHMLLNNRGKILYSENMFHCNCEMKWLAQSYKKLAKKILCRTKPTINNTVMSNKTLDKLSLDNDLICTKPELQLELYEQFREYDYKVTTDNNDIKTYTIELEGNETLNWKCESRGDPAATLTWMSNENTLKIVQPSLRKYDPFTTITNLVVEAHEKSLTFVCKATNFIGENYLKLEVIRQEKYVMLPEKISSLNVGSHSQYIPMMISMPLLYNLIFY